MHPTLLAAAGLLSCLALVAQAPADAAVRRLIVLNKAAGTASLIDANARKEAAVVEVGTGPHEVAVSPDGRTAVVCNYGDQRPGNSLTVIDVAAAKATATFVLEGDDTVDGATKRRTFLRPHGVQYLPDGRHVVVTCEQVRRLLLVDVQERKVVRALPTSQPTLHMVALSRDHKQAFGASIKDGTMSIFDLAGDGAVTVLATGAGAEGIAVAPQTGEVWVTNREADTLSVVDADKRAVAAELATASFPIRIAFTPDGRHALVSCAEAGQLQVFDCKERTLAHTVDLLADKTEQSPLPIGVCVEPEGKFAWVACQRGEFLAVVDLATFAVVDRVKAGPGPDGMAFAKFAPATATPNAGK